MAKSDGMGPEETCPSTRRIRSALANPRSIGGVSSAPSFPENSALPVVSEQDWFSGDVATFGDRLAAAREAAGLTQAGLARRLDLAEADLRIWEEDRAEPIGSALQHLADALNVAPGWLLHGEGVGPDGPPQPGSPEEIRAEILWLRQRASALAEELDRVEKRLEQLLVQEA